MRKLIITEQQYKTLLEISSNEINDKCKEVNLNPTDPQKEASNYKMAHFSVKGMKIAIENPIGSKRYYTDEKTGEKKYNVMKNHYGYFNITKGKDGDAVDVFIGPDIENFDKVYCVDQKNKKGEFDETKVMLGFSSKEQAKQAYFDNFSPDWKGFMYITGVPLKVFKKWLYRGRKQRQPFAKYVYIKKKQLKENKEHLLKESVDKNNPNNWPNVKELGNGEFNGILWGHCFLYKGVKYYSENGWMNMFPSYCKMIIKDDEVFPENVDKYQRPELKKEFEDN